MREIIVPTYPPEFGEKEPMGLVVFEDIVPPHRIAGRVDFRLKGLISGLVVEKLLNYDEGFLLMDGGRRVFPEVLLSFGGMFREFSLELVEKTIKQTLKRLIDAGARSFSLGIWDIWKDEFPLKEFIGCIVRALKSDEGEKTKKIRLYFEPGKELEAITELKRWSHHFFSSDEVAIRMESWKGE